MPVEWGPKAAGSIASTRNFVPESRFGFWFLNTRTWEKEVIRDSLQRLAPLISRPQPNHPVVLDAGCGQGRSLLPLWERFRPERLIGLDMEPRGLARARRHAVRHRLNVDWLEADCAAVPLPDASVDLVFCHQTFHHLVHQEPALAEFYRVLRPGGVLLFAESTRAYINTWCIRFLFRHPMESQRSAGEYLAMIRRAGFIFDQRNLLYPYLWWSRPTIRGMLEMLHVRRVPAPGAREETLVYLAADKPPARSQA